MKTRVSLKYFQTDCSSIGAFAVEGPGCGLAEGRLVRIGRLNNL